MAAANDAVASPTKELAPPVSSPGEPLLLERTQEAVPYHMRRGHGNWLQRLVALGCPAVLDSYACQRPVSNREKKRRIIVCQARCRVLGHLRYMLSGNRLRPAPYVCRQSDRGGAVYVRSPSSCVSGRVAADSNSAGRRRGDCADRRAVGAGWDAEPADPRDQRVRNCTKSVRAITHAGWCLCSSQIKTMLSRLLRPAGDCAPDSQDARFALALCKRAGLTCLQINLDEPCSTMGKLVPCSLSGLSMKGSTCDILGLSRAGRCSTRATSATWRRASPWRPRRPRGLPCPIASSQRAAATSRRGCLSPLPPVPRWAPPAATWTWRPGRPSRPRRRRRCRRRCRREPGRCRRLRRQRPRRCVPVRGRLCETSAVFQHALCGVRNLALV